MKLTIIGLGNMGTALLSGIVKNNIFSSDDIIGCDIKVKEAKHNSDFFRIETTNNLKEAVAKADLILLAVKPQVMAKVLAEIKEETAAKLLVSIAAGIDLLFLQERVADSARLIRVMPNTPALVGAGISALVAGENTTENDLLIVRSIFNSVGELIEVEEEYINAVTALSGSGPAYVYLIIEALADGGVLKGLPRETALKLAAKTVEGSARMVLETNEHPGQLKDKVASPAGTTIAGLAVLEKAGLRSSLIEAVRAAANRAKELQN